MPEPVEPQVDIPCRIFGRFGIPDQEYFETREYTKRRALAVENLVKTAWQAASYHLGPELARAVWTEAVKGKPGRPRGTKLEELDAVILGYIDRCAESDPRPGLITRVSREIYHRNPGVYAASPNAVAMRIRRAMKKRDLQSRAGIGEPVIWNALMGYPPDKQKS